MGKQKWPTTAAVRALRSAGVDYTPHLYDYSPRGGTAASAAALGVDEHAVVKTLVFRDDAGAPLIVLMHGDREVSAKALARQLGARTIAPCEPGEAQRHSGYQVGGTSPFGLRKPIPIYVERTVLALPRVFVNGGKRGFLVELAPATFVSVLGASPVDAAR